MPVGRLGWALLSRHRRSEGAPERVKRQWLVCNSPDLYNIPNTPCAARDCKTCGEQVWVPMLFLPLVEAGELAPLCWSCHDLTGRPVGMHRLEVPIIESMGMMDQAQELLAEMNSHLD
jgi:hypothetical protein